MTVGSDNVFPKVILAEGAAPATPSSGQVKVYAKADGLVYSKDDAGTETPLGGGGGSSLVFKRTVLSGGGNLSTSSTSKTPIDATNLGYLTLTLATGDVVRCELNASVVNTGRAGYDFEVDQPTSSNVYVGNSNEYGVLAARAPDVSAISVVGYFTATEAGAHGFRPVWLVESGFSAAMKNASSGTDDSQISFEVQNLGAPA